MEEEQSSDNRQQEKERLYLRGSPDPLSGPEDMVLALDLAGTLGPSGSDHLSRGEPDSYRDEKSGTGECEKDAVFPEGTGHKDEDTDKLLLLTCNTSHSKTKHIFAVHLLCFMNQGQVLSFYDLFTPQSSPLLAFCKVCFPDEQNEAQGKNCLTHW